MVRNTNTSMDVSCELLTVPQLANELGLSRQTIYQYVAARKIPFIKIGKSVRFRPGEISDWIDGQRIQAVSSSDSSRANRTASGKNNNNPTFASFSAT